MRPRRARHRPRPFRAAGAARGAARRLRRLARRQQGREHRQRPRALRPRRQGLRGARRALRRAPAGHRASGTSTISWCSRAFGKNDGLPERPGHRPRARQPRGVRPRLHRRRAALSSPGPDSARRRDRLGLLAQPPPPVRLPRGLSVRRMRSACAGPSGLVLPARPGCSSTTSWSSGSRWLAPPAAGRASPPVVLQVALSGLQQMACCAWSSSWRCE